MPEIVPFIPTIIAGIGGAMSNNSSATQTPQANPAFGPLQNAVLGMVTNRLTQGPDMTGYTANGVSNINSSYAGANANLQNTLTARGLGRSPAAAAALTKLGIARAGDTATFRNSVPLLSDQLQEQRINDASGLLRTGMGSSGTASSGGGAAGVFTNLAGMLGYLQGKGKFPNFGSPAPVPAGS